MSVTYTLDPMLPWTPVPEEDRRFRRILVVTLGLSLALAVVLPWVPLREPERLAVPEIPQRFAKLVIERRQPPPPPPPPPKAEQPKPEQPKPEATRPEVAPPPPKVVPPKPAPTVEQRATARKRAEKTGVLAFRDSLAGLRDEAPVQQLARQGALNTAGGEARAAERNLLTQKAGQGSGGIDTSRLSRETGGSTGVAGRATTSVEAPAELAAATARAAAKPGQRSDQEIQLVFDQNKSALYALYNRALRSNPALRGKMVLTLTIAPSGEVTAVEIVSSELRDADLERKIELRVRRFNFGARPNAAPMKVRLPIDFLPS